MSESETRLTSVVDRSYTAVLVVDVQPFFTHQDLVPPVDEVLPRLLRFLAAAHDAGVLCVRIRAEFPEERWTPVWQDQFGPDVGPLVAPGSPLVAFHPGFEPQAGDLVLVKDRYSSFFGTPLEDMLRSRGIETVIVTGLVTDICVSSTARDAFQLDFHTITLSDCAAAGSQALHDTTLETLAGAFGRVCSSEDVVAAWQTLPVPAGG